MHSKFINIVSTICLLLSTAFSNAALSEITYYHYDILGSTVAATDTTGNVLWTENYKTYGERINKPVSTNDIWYTGHFEDRDAGLVYAGARWYDPEVGRFMGADPATISLANVHSVNRYIYANNNPYAYVDPNGEFAMLIIWGIGAAITAYDTYQTYQKEGAVAAGGAFARDAAITAVTGGVFKIASKIVTKASKVVPMAVPAAMLSGPATYKVYIGVKNKKELYVGITRQKKLEDRRYQHGTNKKNPRDFDALRELVQGLTVRQARAIEQVIKERAGKNFSNINNSIDIKAKKNDWFTKGGGREWAENWVDLNTSY